MSFLDIIQQILLALPMTLTLAGVSVVAGAIAALGLAIAQQSGNRLVTWPIAGFVAVFRGTPLLAQMYLIYYGLGQFSDELDSIGLWWIFKEPQWCAILALSLNTAAYGSEILRGGLQSVPAGQIEAARAAGMSPALMFRRIVFPIAIRQALPAYGSEIILMVKGTSLASIITVEEVTFAAYRIVGETYRAIEVFACAGIIYLAINFIITRAIAFAEYRLSPHLRPSPPLVTVDQPRIA